MIRQRFRVLLLSLNNQTNAKIIWSHYSNSFKFPSAHFLTFVFFIVSKNVTTGNYINDKQKTSLTFFLLDRTPNKFKLVSIHDNLKPKCHPGMGSD